MGRLLVLGVMFGVCSKAPPAEAPAAPEQGAAGRGELSATGTERRWSATSADGMAKLEQVEAGGDCTVRCMLGASIAWTSTACIGTRDDRVFISNDCSAAIRVVTEPPITRSWPTTEVIFTYRGATLTHTYQGGPMLAQAERAGERYRWLQGEPRYLRSGAGVELRVLSGRATRLPFQEGAAVNEETYVNDRPETPDPPAVRTQHSAYQPYNPPPPPPPVAARNPSPAPAPAPQDRNKPQVTTFCNGSGCWNQLVQPAPTLRVKPGEERLCRHEGDGCGTNADCCGGNCSEGTCH
jgi:hypothetical protein